MVRLIDADALKETIVSNVYPVVDDFNNHDYGMFWTGGIEKAIDEQPTIEERTIIDGSTTTAYGYNLDEICKFAMVCRKEGITEDQLHDFVMNMENAVQVVLKEQQEIIERTFLEITKRTEEPGE